jgi:hypothetical protein
MNWNRIVALLSFVVIALILQFGFDARWYVSYPLGVLAYLVVRYAGWAINERRTTQAGDG